MKNLKSGIITASLVIVPPVLGSLFYLAPFKNGFEYFIDNYLYIARPAVELWPFSFVLRKRTFVAGLVGMHVMMCWFLYSMSMGWGDDLGWMLYLPDLFIGSLIGILISEIAQKVDQWINRFRNHKERNHTPKLVKTPF